MAQKKSPSQTIGTHTLEFDRFKSLSRIFKKFSESSFKKKDASEKYNLISEEILNCIQRYKAPCFLLPAVLEFIQEVQAKQLVPNYTFNSFEFWLNQFSGLSEENNYLVRAKIAGRHIPRDDYQSFFPIGMGKRFAGSHFVTGHGSPDLDTTIASFWGFVDAFAARVSQGLHYWNLPPGGVLTTEDAAPLTTEIGKHLFPTLSQNRSSLTLSGLDYTTQKNLQKKALTDTTIDSEPVRHQKACVVIDDQGYFLGDLRTADYEGIRQIQSIVTHCLVWFENVFHTSFISLFTQEKVKLEDVKKCVHDIFDKPIKRCLDTKHLSPTFYEHFNNFLARILGLEKGLNSSFSEFATVLKKFSLSSLMQVNTSIQKTFSRKALFDKVGHLIQKRPQIFKLFNEVILELDEALKETLLFSETIDVALRIKKEVFGHSPRYVTPISTLDEIRDKMSVFHHLTVVYPNKDGKLWPLGIIRAEDIRHSTLGTVTLRDFCNRDEVKIASYLEVISVVDHHKMELKTKTAPVVISGDVQSSNVLLAEKNFEINDRYPFADWPNSRLSPLPSGKRIKPADLRIQRREISRRLARHQPKEYFIHPDRAYLEYLSYLHAIIDDTDLLSKVTQRDLYCIATILNRMKSILLKKEVEILQLDDIKNDEQFTHKATRAIVENEDMYSLYSKIFKEKEDQINEAIRLAALGKTTEIFSDTKEQNGCCRISQTKIFSTNAVALKKNYEKLLHHWTAKAQEVYENNDQLDLHIHMISTIPNAEEVYKGLPKHYLHRDYLWIWIPNSKQALDHLASFLNAFKSSQEVKQNNMHCQIISSPKSCNYESIFQHHFVELPKESQIEVQKKVPLAILSFDAGTLNSRKAHITPYLPLLVK